MQKQPLGLGTADAYNGLLGRVVVIACIYAGHGNRVARIDALFGHHVGGLKSHFCPFAVGREIHAGHVRSYLAAVQCQFLGEPDLTVGEVLDVGVEGNVDTPDLQSGQRGVTEVHGYFIGLGFLCAHAFERAGTLIDAVQHLILCAGRERCQHCDG